MFLTSRGVTLFFFAFDQNQLWKYSCNIAVLSKLNRESLVHRDIEMRIVIKCLAAPNFVLPLKYSLPPKCFLYPPNNVTDYTCRERMVDGDIWLDAIQDDTKSFGFLLPLQKILNFLQRKH